MDTISLVLFFISLSINFCSMLCNNNSSDLQQLKKLELPTGLVGPESVAFDCTGQGPYVGISDGRVFKWESRGWREFVVSPNRDRAACDGIVDPSLEPKCGRPLGLKFHPGTCELYIADAYFGVMSAGPDGGVATTLVSSDPDGVPFKFINALDIDSTTGTVYFTDSSQVYQSRDAQKIVTTEDQTGRVFSYNLLTRSLESLEIKLAFPNGVALNKDNSYLLVTLTSSKTILKFELNLGHPFYLVLADKLPGFPDNIRRAPTIPDGEEHFWVGLNPGIGNVTTTGHVTSTGDPVAVKVNEHGEIIKTVDGEGGEELDSVSEVFEDGDGSLWFGSPTKSYIGYIGTK